MLQDIRELVNQEADFQQLMIMFNNFINIFLFKIIKDN